MTPKQVYSSLAKIAGHRCHDGKKFIVSKRIGPDHLQIIQNRLFALMEKLQYSRTRLDFDAAYYDATRERERARSIIEEHRLDAQPSAPTAQPEPRANALANYVRGTQCQIFYEDSLTEGPQ